MSAAGIGAPRLHRARWFVVAAMVVALVAGGIGWASRERHRITVGDHIEGVTVFMDQLTENKGQVQTAFGSLWVTIGTGHEVGNGDDKVRAPAGASLVEVSWSPGYTYSGPPVWPGASVPDRRDPGADLSLVTGGRRYPLAQDVALSDGGASVMLLVAGDASDARVESRVGGRTFGSVAGSAAPRTARGDGFSGCSDRSENTYSWVSCTLPAYRGVYVAGLGVAPAGKEWLVVEGASATRRSETVHAYDAHNDSKRAEYVASGPPTVSVTVDGLAAKPRIAGRDAVIGDSVRVAARAWLVPTDRSTTVRLHYRLPTKILPDDSDWPGAPTTYLVDVSTTTTYSGV